MPSPSPWSPSPGGAELGALRATAKMLGLFGVVAVALPLQGLALLSSRGRASMSLPPRFHAAFAAVMGLRVRYAGEARQGRGVVHVCNHLSYMDVQVLGRLLRTRFVAKEEVRGWPLLGLLSRLQQTVFISRARHRAGAVGNALAEALLDGHGLLVFAEGTTSDGSGVLPFKSGVFAPLVASPGLVLQPVRIELLSANGVAIDAGGERGLYAYHGDDTLLPHLWRFLRGSGAELRVTFLPPLAGVGALDRKELARTARAAVAGDAR